MNCPYPFVHHISDGSQVLRIGTAQIIRRDTNNSKRKGAEPWKISSMVTLSPKEDFMANTTIPNGGVSRPISMATIERIAK